MSDLEVGTEGNAVSEAEAIERFEYAFMALAGPIRLEVVEGGAEHGSSAAERVSVGNAQRTLLPHSASLGAAEAESSERRPAALNEDRCYRLPRGFVYRSNSSPLEVNTTTPSLEFLTSRWSHRTLRTEALSTPTAQNGFV
jgi:hypothetical protein